MLYRTENFEVGQVIEDMSFEKVPLLTFYHLIFTSLLSGQVRMLMANPDKSNGTNKSLGIRKYRHFFKKMTKQPVNSLQK